MRIWGLLDVNIQGRGNVGSLVAENKGTIINSYAEGGIVLGTQHSLGGLVAINGDGNDTITIGGVIVNSYADVATTSTDVLTAGGLVGSNRGTIRNSYATGNAIVPCDAGGLVGENRSSASGRSRVINSYALGDVRRLGSCTDTARNRVSGLVALNEGLIRNSLARGQIISGGSVGGVVAAANKVSDDFPAEVEYSYFDSTVNDDITANDDDGISKTGDELMMPIAAGTTITEIYYQWSTADWDFGTTQTYPLLRYTGDVEGSDAVACDADSNAELPLCGGLLPGQHDERLKGLSGILFFAGNALLDESAFDKSFSSLAFNYTMSVEEINTIRLAPYAINPRSEFISIIKDGESPSTDYFAGKRSGEQSGVISVPMGETDLIVRVGNTPGDADPVLYNFSVNNTVSLVELIDLTIIPASRVDEGQAIILSAKIGGGVASNYRYQWSSDSSILSGQDTTAATLSFNIPTDFVPSDVADKSVVIKLIVTDGLSVSSATETVTIVKVNNSDPSFTSRVTTSTISIMALGDELDGESMTEYIWEQRGVGDTGWKEIDNMSNTYTVLPEATGDIFYRVSIVYSDAQGYIAGMTFGPYRLRIDIDDDDDGLIDIYYLEDLDKVRYQLDGSGYKENGRADKITAGCPDNICIGYELRTDLDFATTRSYVDALTNKSEWTVDNFDTVSDTGWVPIGYVISRRCDYFFSNCFSSTFEGNGKRISNLQINRDSTNYIGLFAGNSGSIRNLGLAEPEIEGRAYLGALLSVNRGISARQATVMNSNVVGGSIKGSSNIGGLVSINAVNAIILNSYASVNIEGSQWIGGLVGTNKSRIINSYAAANVADISTVIGGLVGNNGTAGGATIENSYATGSVLSSSSSDNIRTGGLVGHAWRVSNVIDSYAITSVKVPNTTITNNTFGGLIGGESGQSGEANDSTVENSYWNSDTSGQTRSAGGTSKTTIELQTPTTATGIYADWSSDDWDFGTAMSYPALRYNEIDGVDACDSDPDTALPRCGTLLSDQPERDNGLGALFFVVGGAELDNDAVFGNRPFSSLLFNYIVEIPYATALQLRPYAVNNDANISIRQTGNNTDYFANKSGGDLSDEIPLSIENVPTTVTIVVSDANPTTYHFVVRRAVLDVDIMLSITDPAPGSTVNEGDTITAMVSGNSDAYSYSFAEGGIEIASGRSGSASLNLDIPKDLSFAGNATTQRIVFTLSVDNNRNEAEAEIELIVSKQNNGEAQLELNVSPATLRIDSTADDPDGVGAFTYQWQQRDADDGQWMDPVNNTGASYTVSLTANSTIRYRVQVRHSDGQGYTKSWDIGSFPADIDGNDNGLIDIYYLEDLDVVRHQSDGSGYQISSVPNGVTADKITSGCPVVDGVMVCAGYEMLRDLDFTMDNSYVDATANKGKWTVDDFSIDSDTGWLPIGDEANPFAAVLDGNNYAIYNLDINRDTADDGHIGLFGVLSGNARIENMALLDVNIQGRGNVGSLVAENKGTVINSYVGGGAVLGEQHSLGGLVAINGDDDDMITIEGVIVNSYANVVTISVAALTAGGLVGSNRGTIRNSYALGNARGSCDIGGLVGENRSSASGRSQIINSYASVDVSILGSCTNVTRNRASALVAFNEGLISNSLARGQIISGGSSIGGVVAEANDVSDDFPAEVEYSYFDSTVNGDITADDDDGLGKTSDELIMPIAAGTTPTEIYYQWSTDDWDFGTAMEYPVLKYTSATDVLGKPACSESASQALPQCGTAVPNQRFGLSSLQLSAGTKLEAAFNYAVSAQSAIVRNGTEEIRVIPTAFNNNAMIEIIVAGADGTDYSRGNGMNSNPIPLDSTSTVIIITVSAVGESAVRYTINTEILEAFQVSESVSAVIDNSAVDREALSEGETVNLSFRVSGGDVANYRYRWRVSVANTDIATATDLMLDEQQSNAAITVSIPDNFIKSSSATSTQLTLTAAIDDMLTAIERRSVGFKVLKVNNGSPAIDLSVSTSTLSISADSVDPDGRDNYVYAWWQRGIEDSSWMSIADTSATYTIPDSGSSGANRYRVRVTHTDGQGYETSFSRGPFAESPTDAAIRADIDDDDDGLIDIYYLEDLDAIRYQLDGSGYRANDETSKISDGCLAVAEVVQCRGYELRRSLDFDNNAHYIDATNKESWTTGLGWQPIGDFFNAFSTQFRANPANDDSLTISNLMVNRQNIEGAALFGVSSTSSEIYGVRLLDVEVNGRFTVGALVGENYGLIANSSVSGTVEGTDGWIGGLVGTHFGTIVNSYARADVKGQGSVGGLVGYNGDDGTNAGLISHSYAFGNVEGRNYSGGLVGYSQGTIVNSYASGSVVSAFYGGGLVGFNERYRLAGTIRNAYARGTVIGSIYLGGLAGYNASVIDNAYASGAVIGSDGVGGLVGINADPGRVSNSYWDAAASGVAISAGGIAAMSTAMQTSTATQSIYVSWSEADWSFGSADTPKYPTLKYNASSEGDMSLCGDAFLPACGSELPTPEQLSVESSHGRGPLVLTGLQLSEGTLEPAFDPTKTDYELLDVSGAATTVTATAKNALVRIRVNEQAISMSMQASLSVALADLAQHDIVIELSGADRSTQTYTIVLPAAQPALSGAPIGECSLNDIDRDDDGLIEICDIEGLHAMRYQLDGSGYQTSKTASEITSGCDEDGNTVCIGYELMQDLDFNDPAHYRESANQAIWTVSDYDDSMDKGWLPIGDLTNPFVATFNANGYTISNLQINRGDSEDGRDYAGLFSHIGANAQLREVALVEIEVRGRFVVGGLVGLNDGGAIINSHVLGRIEGSQTDGLMNSSWIGGMVGSNDGLIINSYADVDVLGHTTIGGLVGFADRGSRIRNSYALSDVKGRNSVGGLVGVNQGSIRDSYAGGSVDAVRDEINPFFENIEVDQSCRRCEAASQGGVNPAPDIVYYAGGLVGYNDEEGIIINGYAYSSVSGGVLDVGFTGGLVGANLSEPDETNIVNGYWDRDASGVEFSSGSNEDDGLTMEEIQLPSSFEGWSDSDWSFETGEEYPRLRYVAGEDADEPACETPPPDTELPNCGVLLFGQGFELQSIGLRNAVLFPNFDIAIRNYAANVSAETTKVEVIAIASDRAELRVNGEEVSSGEYKVINLDEGDIKIKVVSDSEEVTTYTIVVVRQAEEAAFVQSRFAGQPSDLVCRDCNPDTEGAVRIRFAPQSLALLSNNRVRFKLQFRTIAGAAAGHYISSAGFGLRYNPAAFGENLNTPVLDPYTMGMSQCTYERSDFFDNLDDYNISFSDTAANELNIAEIGNDRNADRGQLNALGTEWSDLVTMTCMIANVSEEAGLAIAGSDPRQIELRRYDDDGDAIPSLALLLADNDLRGLRLDGKTYVEDSTRYSDGSGVRLKFSKGVAVFAAASDSMQSDAMPLMPRNFSLDAPADTMISTVTHIAGSAYAEIEFNEAVPSDILRLASTATYKIYAVDEGFVQGEELAHGNFAAALAYDANAPAVVDVGQVNAATWSLRFDKPIHPATVRKENLCLTNEMDVCADEVQGTSITSVSLMGENNQILQVEIGSIEQTERIAAIEFRRNAMLGADFRVVEGYQLELRDAITIADGVPPTITVEAIMGAAMIQEDPPQTHETITYSVRFTVSANEAIAGLGDAASYRLLRLPNSGEPISINAVASVQITQGESNRATVRYIGIRVPVSDVESNKGFTLARANSTSLQDLSGKDPLGSDSGFLDSRGVMDEGAIALTGDLDDTTLLASLRLSADEASALIFNPTTTTYRIAGVANATTYTTVSATAQNPAKISRIKSSTLEDDIEVDAVDVQSHRIPLTEGGETTITLVVIAQDGESEQEYIVVVERLPSADESLTSLEIASASGSIELDPMFSEDETDYTAGVASDLSVTISAGAAHPQATIQIAKGAITEDTPSVSGEVANATIELNLRTTTTVIIRVTAQDEETAQDYIVAVTRLPSEDESLASLGIASASGSIALDPVFADDETDYTAEVSGDLSVTISAEATHPQSTIQIAKEAITGDTPNFSGESASATIELNLKTTTTVVIRVIAEDGIIMQDYTIALTRVPEADATLETLTIAGDLVADFDPAIAEYTVEVEGKLAIDLFAKATHDQAMIQIAGTSGVGEVSTQTQLNLATTTTIVIEVSSEDRENTRAYTIAVIRLPSKDASLESLGIVGAESGAVELLPGGFASTRTDYMAEMASDLSVTISAGAAHPQATIQIAKGAITEDTPSVSGEVANATIDLNLKTTTTVVIRVIAEDGIAMQDYTIAVTRLPSEDESLASLGIASASGSIELDPMFSEAETDYTAEVEDDLSVTISAEATHPQSTIQIAKEAITEDTPGVSGEVANATIELNLKTTTTVVIRVIAEDGIMMQDYTIALIRVPEADATLETLTIAGESVADFDPAIAEYIVEVEDNLEIELSAKATHDKAMIQIAGTSGVGEVSTQTQLNLRTTTTIVIEVTSEDRENTRAYTIAVTRLPSEDASLESLGIVGAESGAVELLPGGFASTRTDYMAEMASDLSVTINAEATHPQATIQIAKGAITEDTPSVSGEVANATIELNLKTTTTVVIRVIAEDGIAMQDYIVAVTRLPSADESLASLGIASASGSIELDPVFADDETDYTAEVSGDLSVTISAEATHPQSTIQIAKEAITEDTPSVSGEVANATIELNLRTTTTVVIRVISEDGIMMQDYTIALTRVPEADATLEILTIAGDLVADFDPATTEYTVEVEDNLEIELSAKATHDKAMIQIAGTSSVGEVSTRTQLNLRTTTTLVIEVTSEDGENTRAYTVAVIRLPSKDASLEGLGIASASGSIALVPVFASTRTDYMAEMEDDLSVTINAEATHPQATIQIAKGAITEDTPSVSGEVANATIVLNLKTTTTVVIRVIAEDGITMQDYTIAVTRLPSEDESLASLGIASASGSIALDPVFADDETDYTAEVSGDLNVTISAEATHPQSTIQIAKEAITEDTPGVSGEVANATIDLNLKTTTTVVIRVIAEDGIMMQDYTIALIRVPEADATLETLTIAGDLVAGFDPATTEYTVEVEGNLAIDINAKATHDQAMIQIAGTSDVGEVSTQTQLNLRTTTTIVIEVTSEDGENTRAYTVAVIRLPSEDESLASLGIASASGNIALVPVFASTRTDYMAEVEDDLSVTISAEATHPQATIQIAKAMIEETTPSFSGEVANATIELNLKTTTTVVIRVIAEDGIMMQDYTIAVKRLPSEDESLASLGIASASGSIALDPVFSDDETDYTAEVSGDLNVTISAEATHPQSTIQIAKEAITEDTPGVSGEVANATIDLNLKTTTTVVIRVIAEDGIMMQDYTIALTRVPEADATLETLTIAGESVAGFDPAIAEYIVEVEDNLEIELSAKATHDQAMIQIAGTSDVGEVSTRTQLNLRTTTTIVIEVTSEDGENTRAYTIAVIRLPSKDASLESLGIVDAESGAVELLPGGFASTRTDYTAEVSGDLSVTISAEATHPQSTIQIAKRAITEDTPGVSGEVANATIELNLKTTTTVIIRVTAEDGIMMQDYTIAVTRLPEADATLETLTIEGDLVAGFDPAIAEYTVEVEGNLAIDISAKATHDQAMIQIAGTSGIGQVSTRTQLNLATTTTLAIQVTSEDRENTRAYTIAVIRLPSEDESLASLGIASASGSIELDPVFSDDETDYTAEVSGDLSVTISAEATHPQSTIQIAKRAITEDTPGVSGEVANATIDLNLKTTTTVVIRVIAEDGIMMQDYTIALTRVPEADATLETLTIEGESVAGFDPAIAEYTVEVEGKLAIDINAKATHDQAMIQIAGTSGIGEASTQTQLNLGTTTTIVIEVTSEDGENTRAYTIAVKRLPSEDESLASLGIASASSSIELDPVFADDETDYTAEVSGDLSVTISAEATDPQATIQIAKEAITEDTPGVSGEVANATIELNLKTTTTVVIRVIAEDGIMMQDYTIALIRVPEADATLETLTIDGESVASFDPAIAEYTVEVEGNLAIDLFAKATHDQAMIQIAGTSSVGEVSTQTQLNLATTTTIVIEVTSEDGENTRAYTIAVTRLPSADESLASLGIASASGSIALDPVFADDETDYTAEVSGDLSVTISAEATDPQATIQIAKEAITEDTPSVSGEVANATIELNLKTTTTVVIRVTAEDRTTQDYTIALTRVPEADATLETLTIAGESVAGFDPAKEEYIVEVEGNLAIDISAKATHDQAMIQIAGTSGIGEVSTQTQLNLATTTTLAIEVTSEDGENTRAYTIAIKRLPSEDESLASLGIASASGSIELDPMFSDDETDYTAEVSGDLSVTISAEATHPQATIQIAKEAITEDTPGVSGEVANAAIDLNLKTTTTVVIRVIAEDGITMQDYTILITRVPEADATLETLTIAGDLVAGFDPAKEEYIVEVEGNLAIDISAKATHDQAMIQIAGTSGIGQVSTQTQLNLRTTTTIVIEVTSEDSENTRAYTIAIKRLPSSDTGLTNLEIASAGTNENIPLLPSGFSSTKTDYTAEVRGSRQILVIATATHPQARFQVAKTTIIGDTPILKSGEASAALELNQGTTTTLVIQVIAEDGTPSEDLYTVEISYVVGYIRIRAKIFLEGPLR